MEKRITNLTDLTASHKVGIMFTIVAISFQDERIEIFNNIFERQRLLMTWDSAFKWCYVIGCDLERKVLEKDDKKSF